MHYARFFKIYPELYIPTFYLKEFWTIQNLSILSSIDFEDKPKTQINRMLTVDHTFENHEEKS